MLKVYGQARSRTFRVLWFCIESGIPYEHIPLTIHVAEPQVKEDWYRKLNPNARIPCIDDDGFIMWESLAINFYLAQKYKSPLWPSDPKAQGRAFQWAFFVANDVEAPLTTVFQQRVVFPADKRDPALEAEADQRLKPKLQVLEDHLASNSYFAGDAWGMADFMVASVTFGVVGMKYDLSAYPHFDAWLKATLDRPKAKEAMKLRA